MYTPQSVVLQFYWLGLSLVPLSCPIPSLAAVAISTGPLAVEGVGKSQFRRGDIQWYSICMYFVIKIDQKFNFRNEAYGEPLFYYSFILIKFCVKIDKLYLCL